MCAAYSLILGLALALADGQSLRTRKLSPSDPRLIKNPAQCQALCAPLETQMSSTLPNVFIFGDSVSQAELGYFNVTKTLLLGKAEVHGIPMPKTQLLGLCGTSFGALSCVDQWLGKGKWDVISFNWGFHDMCHDYYGDVSRHEYRDNIEDMYHALSKHHLKENGRIVWQSTTPVPPDVINRRNIEVVRLNKLADEVLAEAHPPPIMNDLYGKLVVACNEHRSAACFPESCTCEEYITERQTHMSDRGNDFLGSIVANSIMDALQ